MARRVRRDDLALGEERGDDEEVNNRKGNLECIRERSLFEDDAISGN